MTDIQTDEIDRQFERVTVTDPAGFDRYSITGRTHTGDNITVYAENLKINGNHASTGYLRLEDETVTLTKTAGSGVAEIRT